jgi:tRNA(Ile2) C34 agmatinyltransferase TiaS
MRIKDQTSDYERILSELRNYVPGVKLEAGSTFHWSPQRQTIVFNTSAMYDDHGIWALLHEYGHATCVHTTFSGDSELLQIEVEAWHAAEKLAKKLEITIDQDHIQDCLDTYRDWLHQRSKCPRCGIHTLQIEERLYECFNCSHRWSVSEQRFCRPYRKTK